MAADRRYVKEATRESATSEADVADSVREIVSDVKREGDEAVRALTSKFDDVEREQLQVQASEFDRAREALTAEERETIDRTIGNVKRFHEAQLGNITGFETETEPGIRLGQRVLPVQTAGVYIPGGRHPLVASPAMGIVPATVAGVERIIACAPPQSDGSIHAPQLYAMERSGADEVYCIGGAQAIAAMAYGTETVPSSDMVTGPGNVYTTEAKRQVYGDVGIDFLAGPTEVLVIADETVEPRLVATDLLAQAEHDPHSRAVLVSTSEDLAAEVLEAVEEQLPQLETAAVASQSWEQNGEVIVVSSRDAAATVSNDYAMEHVQVMTERPRELMENLHNYGSLFLGEHAPVVFGDKAVGTNHILPTREVATYQGGIWVGTYLKTLTHQELTAEGAASLAPWAAQICEIEGTHAHRLSAEARLASNREEDVSER